MTFLNTKNFIVYNDPSLIDLITFTNSHGEYFSQLDLSVLNEYYKHTIDDLSGGKYYLHGYLPLFPDTPITPQIIDDAKNIHIQRNLHYGNICTPIESVYINDSINKYKTLVSIINLYQTIVSEPYIKNYKNVKESFFDT
jgi:hypothetical protein